MRVRCKKPVQMFKDCKVDLTGPTRAAVGMMRMPSACGAAVPRTGRGYAGSRIACGGLDHSGSAAVSKSCSKGPRCAR